jgi:hypothetical protein
LILENLLVNNTLALTVSPGHIKTLFFRFPKILFKGGQNILYSIAEVHEHPNGDHLNGGGTQVVLFEKVLDIGPIEKEDSNLLKMKLFISSFIKVV